jgi:lipopolysaccharide biosynthesis glycosyltransferase
MIPRILQKYDRVVWFDADTLILKDLNTLININMEDRPLAATFPGADFQRKEWQYMPFQFENPEKYPEYTNINALQAGVLVYNIPTWNRLHLDEKVDNCLMSDIKFKYVVQGLLGYVLKGNFKRLEDKWNCPVSWLKYYNLQDIAVLHFVGGAGRNPWQSDMPQKDLWNQYYRSGK